MRLAEIEVGNQYATLPRIYGKRRVRVLGVETIRHGGRNVRRLRVEELDVVTGERIDPRGMERTEYVRCLTDRLIEGADIAGPWDHYAEAWIHDRQMRARADEIEAKLGTLLDETVQVKAVAVYRRGDGFASVQISFDGLDTIVRLLEENR